MCPMDLWICHGIGSTDKLFLLHVTLLQGPKQSSSLSRTQSHTHRNLIALISKPEESLVLLIITRYMLSSAAVERQTKRPITTLGNDLAPRWPDLNRGSQIRWKSPKKQNYFNNLCKIILLVNLYDNLTNVIFLKNVEPLLVTENFMERQKGASGKHRNMNWLACGCLEGKNILYCSVERSGKEEIARTYFFYSIFQDFFHTPQFPWDRWPIHYPSVDVDCT